MDKELKDIGTRNWVKTWLALRYFKEAILPFMKDKCDEQYRKDILFIKPFLGLQEYTCKLCKVGELKPFHSSVRPCKYGHVKSCACKGNKKKNCPEKESCGLLCDLIIDVHVKNDPNWSNTNSEFWSDDTRGPWERMKCFIHTPGYKEKTDISEADITAFVQICTSNDPLKTEFGTDIGCLEKVRDIRNAMCHSGSMKVARSDFLSYVNDIENALKLNIFDDYSSAKDALHRLQNLEHESKNVSIEDEMIAREDTLLAIRELKTMLEHQVTTDDLRKEIAILKSNEDEHRRKLDKRFNDIEKHMLQLQEEYMSNKTRLDEHKTICTNIDNGVASLHTAVNKISNEMQEGFKKTLCQNEQILKDLAVLKQLYESSLQSPGSTTLKVPDSKLVVNVRNSQGGELVSDLLVKSMNGVQLGVPKNELQRQLEITAQQVFTGGVEYKEAKNECMALYITFASFKSWLEFLSKYLNGELAKAFLPVQNHLRTYLGYEQLELSVDVYEEDFQKCVQSILYQLAIPMLTAIGQDAMKSEAAPATELSTLKFIPLSDGQMLANTASDDDINFPNKILIKGIPTMCKEVQIAKYMLKTTGYTMVQGSMTFHSHDATVAMATFKEDIDIDEVIQRCTSAPFEDVELHFSPVPVTRSVYITHLPSDVDIDTIVSYFESNKEHFVEDVKLKEDRGSCVVVFRNRNIIEAVLSIQHYIGGRRVDVFRYFPCIKMPEPDQIAYAVYNKVNLCISRQHYDDIDTMEILNPESGIYVCKGDFDSVHIHILYNPNIDNQHKHLQRLLSCCGEKYRTITINVVGFKRRNIDTVVQTIREWIQHIKRSPLDKLCLWSEDEEYLHSLTSAVQDINTKLECLPANGDEDISRINQEFYSSKLLVTSLHEETNETDLDQFLREHTAYRLVMGSMVFHTTKRDTAMITFEDEIDYMRVVTVCGSYTLNGIAPQFRRIAMSNCVMVSHVSTTTDTSMVYSYFDGEKFPFKAVEMLPGTRSFLVTLMDFKDADTILARKHCIDGCDVNVKRYFTCIERTEPENIFCMRVNKLTLCLSLGDWKGLPNDKIELADFLRSHMYATPKYFVNSHLEINCDEFDFPGLPQLAFLWRRYKSMCINLDGDTSLNLWLHMLNQWLDRLLILSPTTCILDKIYICCRKDSDFKRIETKMRTMSFTYTTKQTEMRNTIKPFDPLKKKTDAQQIVKVEDTDTSTSSDEEPNVPWLYPKPSKSSQPEQNLLSASQSRVYGSPESPFKDSSIYETRELEDQFKQSSIYEEALAKWVMYKRKTDRRKAYDSDSAISNEWESDKGGSDIDEDDENQGSKISPERTYELRDYQLELSEKALRGTNTIICAETGTGKTWVALHVIDKHLAQASKSPKKVAFMARTGVLIKQQSNRFQKYLPHYNTKLITGDDEDSRMVDAFIPTNDIICFTPQILVNSLDSGNISSLSKFSLLVFDECHHTRGDEPYARLAREYMIEKAYGQKELPQVVGLTASIGVGRSRTVEEAVDYILHVCASLDVRPPLSTVERCRESLKKWVNTPEEETIKMIVKNPDPCKDILLEAMEDAEALLGEMLYFQPEMIDMLNEKRPGERDSQAYHQWTIDIEKSAQQNVNDHEISRDISACAVFLNVYNSAIEVSNLLQIAEVAKYLSEKHQRELEGREKHTDTEKKLFDNLIDVQRKLNKLKNDKDVANPNVQIVSEQLQKMILEKGDDSRAIVFVQARATCRALAKYLDEDLQKIGVKASLLYGQQTKGADEGMTEAVQTETLQKFRDGYYKVMVCTSVGTEGIDVPDCNIVINYNYSGDEITKIQMKGRSRKKGATIEVMGHDTQLEQEMVNAYKANMMYKAIGELQKINARAIEHKLKMFQTEEMQKHRYKTEYEKAKKSRRAEDDLEILCRRCNSMACLVSDVRKLGSQHFVIAKDFPSKITTKPHKNPKKYDGIKKKGKMYCKKCPLDWGIVADRDGVDLFILKLQCFKLRNTRTGVISQHKKWLDVPYDVQELGLEDIPKFFKIETGEDATPE